MSSRGRIETKPQTDAAPIDTDLDAEDPPPAQPAARGGRRPPAIAAGLKDERTLHRISL